MGEDPRIRRRRIDVKRSAGRRRLRRLLWIGGAGLVVLAAVGILQTPLLDVDHIEVEGTARATPEELIDLAGLERGEQMIAVDEGGIADAVGTHPFVASVDVTLEWPGTVRIAVDERTPAFEVVDGAEFAVVADDGIVVSREQQTSTTLIPVVTADEEPDLQVGDAFTEDGVRTLVAEVGEDLRAWIDRVEIDPERGLVVNLVGSAEALVGDAEQLEQKLVSLATVLGRVELACVTEIDVQVPDSPVVRRGCT